MAGRYRSSTIAKAQSSLEILMSMGFPRKRAEKALVATGDIGVQEASEWCATSLRFASRYVLQSICCQDFVACFRSGTRPAGGKGLRCVCVAFGRAWVAAAGAVGHVAGSDGEEWSSQVFPSRDLVPVFQGQSGFTG
jgi:hypothetical protein